MDIVASLKSKRFFPTVDEREFPLEYAIRALEGGGEHTRNIPLGCASRGGLVGRVGRSGAVGKRRTRIGTSDRTLFPVGPRVRSSVYGSVTRGVRDRVSAERGVSPRRMSSCRRAAVVVPAVQYRSKCVCVYVAVVPAAARRPAPPPRPFHTRHVRVYNFFSPKPSRRKYLFYFIFHRFRYCRTVSLSSSKSKSKSKSTRTLRSSWTPVFSQTPISRVRYAFIVHPIRTFDSFALVNRRSRAYSRFLSGKLIKS